MNVNPFSYLIEKLKSKVDTSGLDCTRHTFSETLANGTASTLMTYTATKNEYKNIFANVRFKADGASVTANHGIYNAKIKINGNTIIEEQHGFVEKTYYIVSLSGVLPLKQGDVVTVTAVENNGVSIPIDGSLWY